MRKLPVHLCDGQVSFLSTATRFSTCRLWITRGNLAPFLQTDTLKKQRRVMHSTPVDNFVGCQNGSETARVPQGSVKAFPQAQAHEFVFALLNDQP